ncbi:DUF2125 domain-containing protein [Hoeflea poritis]|uniref:DUF2125 domain-containing protein n=1 Tax=Hoeflea poritis TaxID=2993659 RepID=A0ABT4VMA5_9HYPH|nr:DUF2125 domain-containing protein [Hoeflea poritis]MDA4845801.1 DUF2125 domain-containing protein [Hoeflea poritis]
MARSSGKKPAKSSRRFLWLAIGIVVAIGAYTGVWFYLADQLESRSQFLLSDLRDQNVTADCRDMDVRGYPFRLGLYCTSVLAKDNVADTTVTAGSFRSAAQVYKPNHIVSELDGPVSVEAAIGLLADLDWEVLRSSTVFNLSGLDRASLETRNLQAAITLPGETDPVEVAAASSELHARQNSADLDAVLRLNTASLVFGGVLDTSTTFDMQADLTLGDRAWLLSGGGRTEQQPWRNLSASLNSLNADLNNGAGLSIEGPFSIDAEGYLTGKFNLEIRDMKAWQEFIGTVFPDMSDDIANAAGIAVSINGGGSNLSLPINVDKGTVRIGFIQLGKIPPL